MGLSSRGIKGIAAVVAAATAFVAAPSASAAEYELILDFPRGDDARAFFGVEDGTPGLTVTKRKPRLISTSTYLYRGERERLGRDGAIDVDLGSRGSIVGEFVANGSRNDRPPTVFCESVRTRRGFLVGEVDVHGIPGLPAFEERRVRAMLTTRRRTRCTEPPDVGDLGRSAPESTRARAVALVGCSNRDRFIYGAGETDEKRGEIVHAAYGSDRPEPGVLAVHYVTLLDDVTSFEFAPDLLGATVSPGAPFTGTGAYANDRLAGDLAVTFAGETEATSLTPGPARLRKSEEGQAKPPCDFEDPDDGGLKRAAGLAPSLLPGA